MDNANRYRHDRLLLMLSWWQAWYDLGDDIRVEELYFDPTDQELAHELDRCVARRRRLALLLVTSRAARSCR
ncbi:MAG: hypothetical protein K1X57_06990 [Gemmataceae bacterium]|nr:hypothetical protein [Gemmataceae bacterium]